MRPGPELRSGLYVAQSNSQFTSLCAEGFVKSMLLSKYYVKYQIKDIGYIGYRIKIVTKGSYLNTNLQQEWTKNVDTLSFLYYV